MKIEIELPEPIVYNLDEFKTVPEIQGVYVFYSELQELLYVGKSKNVQNRMYQHKFYSNHGKVDREKFKFVSIYPINSPVELEIVETYLINKWAPPFNTHKVYVEKRCQNHNKLTNIEHLKINLDDFYFETDKILMNTGKIYKSDLAMKMKMKFNFSLKNEEMYALWDKGNYEVTEYTISFPIASTEQLKSILREHIDEKLRLMDIEFFLRRKRLCVGDVKYSEINKLKDKAMREVFGEPKNEE